MSLQATVTRTSEVRPELLFGSFTCGNCGTRIKNVEQQFKYTEPTRCSNGACGGGVKTKATWHLDLPTSKFCDWQKLHIQENASDIPSGSMPRSLDVILRADAVEAAKPGDKIVFTGCLIVVPDVGQLRVAGVLPQSVSGRDPSSSSDSSVFDGVRGIKDLGTARELTYRLCFLASTCQQADTLSLSSLSQNVCFLPLPFHSFILQFIGGLIFMID